MNLSVIIPVKNGEATLERCLQSLAMQTVSGQMEVIILDTMSTDRSAEIALEFGAKLIRIPETEFNHGLTRNLGATYAAGEFIYYTVQDAWIAGSTVLETMLQHFKKDETLMAVGGHQAVPHERDKNPMLWYRPISTPGVYVKQIENETEFITLPSDDRQAIISWDNVVAMYRRSAITELPFIKTAFAEDWIWSYQAQRKGWKLLYDSSLVVYHYHHKSYRYAFRTKYTVSYHLSKYLDLEPRLPSLLIPLIRTVYHLSKHRALTLAEKRYWIQHNALAALAEFHAVIVYKLRAAFGQQFIEKGYIRHCATIPQGRQNTYLNTRQNDA